MAIQQAWRGSMQNDGYEGKRVLVVGYSFYYTEGEELHPGMVADVVQRVIEGTDTHTFWAAIAGYFGARDRRSFWKYVGFIEYVPGPIGNEDHSTDAATSEQVAGAPDRLLDIMDEQKSEIAFVFSTKAAYNFKLQGKEYIDTITQFSMADAEGCLENQFFDEAKATRGARNYRIILAPHPQGSDKTTMREMVKRMIQ